MLRGKGYAMDNSNDPVEQARLRWVAAREKSDRARAEVTRSRAANSDARVALIASIEADKELVLASRAWEIALLGASRGSDNGQ
jgi:hypothetical protein